MFEKRLGCINSAQMAFPYTNTKGLHRTIKKLFTFSLLAYGISNSYAAPFAYIPRSFLDDIAIVDIANNTITDTIDVGNEPHGVAISNDGSRVYISNGQDHTVDVMNTTTNAVIATINTGLTGFGTTSITLSPNNRRLYITNEESSSIVQVDTDSNQVSKSATLSQIEGPYSMAISPSGKNLYLAMEGQIDILSTQSLAILNSILINEEDLILDMTFSIDGTKLYLSNNDTSTIDIVDIDQKLITKSIALPDSAHPRGITLNPTGSKLFVANEYDSSISVIDTATDSQLETIPITLGDKGPTSVSASPDGRLLYVTTTYPFHRPPNRPDVLHVISTLTGTLVDQISLGVDSFPIAIGQFIHYPDTDGDGLLDTWETSGIDFDGNHVVDLVIPDSDPMHKDLYVEIDWMELHKPDALAIQDTIAAFSAVPAALVKNPDGAPGINLHLDIDEQATTHNNNLSFTPCTNQSSGIPDFDALKSQFFGTSGQRSSTNATNIINAKRLAYRYSLFAHSLLGKGATSGCAELPGNDFVVSLGGWPSGTGHPRGNRDTQSGTFMHEFGHTLNLGHGGLDGYNCKPNYLSVMSYTFQLNNNPVTNRPLDYSQSKLATLVESGLIESVGIGGPAGLNTAYGPSPVQVTPANLAIDWNRNGNTTDTISSPGIDINNLGSGCSGSGTTLEGYDDWSNLLYNFRVSSDFGDGVHNNVVTTEELTFEQALELSPDTDGDGVTNLIDNCPFDVNPTQSDSDDDGVGDACEDFLLVEIDVKPGSFPNVINLGSNGVTPVAILSTGSFDATTIDPESIILSGATIKLVGKGKRYLCKEKDINQDGFTDLDCKINTAEFLLEPGASMVILEGRTDAGVRIRGEDSVEITPNN